MAETAINRKKVIMKGGRPGGFGGAGDARAFPNLRTWETILFSSCFVSRDAVKDKTNCYCQYYYNDFHVIITHLR